VGEERSEEVLEVEDPEHLPAGQAGSRGMEEVEE
jgi:hypothetical protein